MMEMKSILASASILDEIASKTLFSIGGFHFTNHMLMISVAAILLLIVIPLSVAKIKLVPHGAGNAIEAICVFIREDLARPFLKEQTDKYIGFLWTLFFFILTMNMLGLVPLDRIFWLVSGGHENHLSGSPTANIWVTGALATFAFVVFHGAGIAENGIIKYFKEFCPKVPKIMYPFLYPLEIISSFVRLFSLAIRLFANILAGHILLGTILGFIVVYKNMMVATASLSFTVLMSLMEIFVAFLQAYIFTFLTAIFMGFAIHPDH